MRGGDSKTLINQTGRRSGLNYSRSTCGGVRGRETITVAAVSAIKSPSVQTTIPWYTRLNVRDFYDNNNNNKDETGSHVNVVVLN